MADKERAALLAQTRPGEQIPADIIADLQASVNDDELDQLISEMQMKPGEVIAAVRQFFPSFDKTLLSKCRNPKKYGVVIHPLAEAAVRCGGPFEPVPEPPKPIGKMTQCERILWHLRIYGSITSQEAVRLYGIMRLASRINDLRKRGYNIETVTETDANRYGEQTAFARYYYHPASTNKE